MTDDRMAGTWRNVGGKVQEGVGKTTGDTKSEMKDVMNQSGWCGARRLREDGGRSVRRCPNRERGRHSGPRYCS